VYEQAEYPFLPEELLLIKKAVEAASRDLPGQPAPRCGPRFRSQAGETEGNRLARSDSLFSRESDALFQDLPPEFTCFHWHGAVFSLPTGATALAGDRDFVFWGGESGSRNVGKTGRKRGGIGIGLRAKKGCPAARWFQSVPSKTDSDGVKLKSVFPVPATPGAAVFTFAVKYPACRNPLRNDPYAIRQSVAVTPMAGCGHRSTSGTCILQS